jgi:hypothetical protein
VQTTFPRVTRLRALLGSQAVLIPIPRGTKKPTDRGWTGITTEHLSDPTFLARLESGNIGVLLGTKSGDLVTVDCDNDPFRDAMLESNPWLADTLTTAGARGCNFWLRLKGSYPTRTRKLKDVSGNDLGEWRADGSQTVISGLHPSGVEYRIPVEKPPLEVSFERIVLPKRCLTQLVKSLSTERLSNRVTEPTSNRATDSVGGVLRVDVRLFLPTRQEQNHSRLFDLARAVRSAEQRIDRAATRNELRDVFNGWHACNQFLRQGQTLADYWLEFMEAYANAHTGIGENPLPQAWQRAITEPLPPGIAERLRDEENEALTRVAALCYQLQKHVGDTAFILSCRSVGELVERDFKLASLYLRRLRSLGIIKEMEKGNKVKASRYRCTIR